MAGKWKGEMAESEQPSKCQDIYYSYTVTLVSAFLLFVYKTHDSATYIFRICVYFCSGGLAGTLF